MWRFLKGCAISGILRENGIRFLRSVADYCERTITPEHRYNLLRLDGHQAVVSSLWDCDPHEAMRLPMIYGIAWDMTGEPHYFDLMNRYAQAGLRHTLTLAPEADYWWDMPLLQMQLSLNFFCESGVLPALTAENPPCDAHGGRSLPCAGCRLCFAKLKHSAATGERFMTTGEHSRCVCGVKRFPVTGAPVFSAGKAI